MGKLTFFSMFFLLRSEDKGNKGKEIYEETKIASSFLFLRSEGKGNLLLPFFSTHGRALRPLYQNFEKIVE